MNKILESWNLDTQSLEQSIRGLKTKSKDDASPPKTKKRKKSSSLSSDKKKRKNTIQIKIAPKVNEKNQKPESVIDIDQLIDDENPITLRVNDQPLTSYSHFQRSVDYPETINITIDSNEANIKLPDQTESPTKDAKLADTQSTKSDLRSLFEAYQTDNSNFSGVFKPTYSEASSRSINEPSVISPATSAPISSKASSYMTDEESRPEHETSKLIADKPKFLDQSPEKELESKIGNQIIFFLIYC